MSSHTLNVCYKMKSLHLLICLLLSSVSPGSCWQYFVPLNDVTLYMSKPDSMDIHSDYTYGSCNRKKVMLYTHIHIEHLELLGKIIVRGWLDLRRIPTCIVLRAKSYAYDLFRSTAYEFQICVPRITYCHSHQRYRYYFYEWYLPYDFIGGMDWDIYFYGPMTLEW